MVAPFSLDCAKEVQTLSAGKQSKLNRKMSAKRLRFFAQSRSKIKQKQHLYRDVFCKLSVRPGGLPGLLAPLTRQGELSECNGISTSVCIPQTSATYSVRLIQRARQRCPHQPRKSALRSCMFSTGTPSRSTTLPISKFWNGRKSPKHGRRTKSPTEAGRGTPLKPLFAHAASSGNEPGLQLTATSNKLRRVDDE